MVPYTPADSESIGNIRYIRRLGKNFRPEFLKNHIILPPTFFLEPLGGVEK